MDMKMIKGLPTKEYFKKWRQEHPSYNREWRKKHPEYVLLQAIYYRQWYAERGRQRADDYRKIIEQWHKEHPEAVKASNLVNWAVKKGIIKKPEQCEFCKRDNTRINGHHPAYDKPLNVIWLCNSCHKKLHIILNNNSQSFPAKSTQSLVH
jgi:hypothetical protein